MNALDERAQRAAASVRRLADTVDPEMVLERIEGRSARQRWLTPVMAVGTAAALALVAVVAINLLSDTGVRIDNEPGVVGNPDGGDESWPPAGYVAEDGWIHLDPAAHGIDGLPQDVVAFQDGFLLADGAGRIWRSTDGLSWENRSGLDIPNADLVVDRGRVIAMGVVNDGRELRVSWSTDGDNWTTVENRGQLTVSVGEKEWFQPRIVAGPRGFVIASNVWLEQASNGTVTGPSNQGAKIRVLESPDGAEWRSTVEWGSTGTANLIGLAGDTNAYTLVYQGDDPTGEVDKGRVWTFSSGDSDEWIEVDDHPGGRPVRLARSQPVPFIGDGPQGDDLTVPGIPVHTWEFSIGEPFSGDGVWLRTSGTWEQAQFRGEATNEPGWYATSIWDGGDALYAHVVSGDRLASTVYRSQDGFLWDGLPQEPVFANARLAGNNVVSATNGSTSLFALACCVEGVFDRNTTMELWVRVAPSTSSEPGTSAGPTDQPTEPASCGTDGLSGEPEPQAGLPDAVQTMRVEIASAAVSCNYGLLAELAGDTFTASFGGNSADADWWENSDLRTLRLMLDLPYAIVEGSDPANPIHAWPSAFVENTDEAWQALYDAGLATPEDRASMAEFFDGWVGFRHGITADGDWVFYVAGD